MSGGGLLGKSRSGVAVLFSVITGLVGLLGTPYEAQSQSKTNSFPFERTDPRHIKPRPLLPDAPKTLPHRPPIDDSTLAFRFPRPLKEWARLNKPLCHLCSRGAFIQPRDGRYYAATPQERYGVGFADGRGLADPQHKAIPGTVYFFLQSDTARCLVYSAAEDRVAPYKVRGSSWIPGE